MRRITLNVSLEHVDGAAVWSGDSPDLPELVAVGESFAELVGVAREAVEETLGVPVKFDLVAVSESGEAPSPYRVEFLDDEAAERILLPTG